MSIPSIEDLLNAEVQEFSDEPIPVGVYNAVITGTEVRPGNKGPYISVESTIFDGDEARRKSWGISSFSDKAQKMPGGPANLVQATQPDIDRDTPVEELPAAIAAGVLSTPVSITIEHEQVERNGVKQELADGRPEMRARTRQYGPADEEFIAAFEAYASGGDDDLPF